MTFAQRRNCLTTHFSERIPVVKRRISVFDWSLWCRSQKPLQTGIAYCSTNAGYPNTQGRPSFIRQTKFIRVLDSVCVTATPIINWRIYV